MTMQNFLSRRMVVYVLIALGLVALAVEIAVLLPTMLERWHPYDYWRYTEMGMRLRENPYSYGTVAYDSVYPLPAQLWIFVPLSFLPLWFRFVWILFPIFSLLVLFRTRALLTFLFPPLWFVIGDAMIDGWMLFPLLWLFENRPVWAGIGAIALLVKPQVAFLTVLFMIARWVVTRDRKNFFAFAVAFIVFCLPAFILDPIWPLHMLQSLPARAGEATTVIPQFTTALWTWRWLGVIGWMILIAMLAATGMLFWRVIRIRSNRAPAVQLLNLLIIPILYAPTFITALLTLRGRNQIAAIVLISLAAFALDRALGGFGGGYAFIPLAALYFQTPHKTATQ